MSFDPPHGFVFSILTCGLVSGVNYNDNWHVQKDVILEADTVTLENGNLTINIDPLTVNDDVNVILGQNGNSHIQVTSGQLAFAPTIPVEKFGFTVADTAIEEPEIELTVAGQNQTYALNGLRNGQILKLGREIIQVSTMADSNGTTFNFTGVGGSEIEEVTISGEGFELNNITSLENK